MMKRSDKSGVSTIVAILMVILFVLVAVAIIWVAVKAFIQKSTEEITLSKITINLKIDSVRIDDDINVKVKRNTGKGDLKGISFIIFDGKTSTIIEKNESDFSLQELEVRTFKLYYTGQVEKISIAPILKTDSGKLITGGITDVYYISALVSGGPGPGPDPSCIPDCGTRECGPDPQGCGTTCGDGTDCSSNPLKPYCNINRGMCTDCLDDCSVCAPETCEGDWCDGGCGIDEDSGCQGLITPEEDCRYIECGPSPHGCSLNCASCEGGVECDNGLCCGEGAYNNNGVCSTICIPDCEGRECGPDLQECGATCGDCVELYNSSYSCNLTVIPGFPSGTGICEMCVGNCGARVCGPVPNGCGESCGTCTEGRCINETGICKISTFLNEGDIYSVWPINIGIYFDSLDLPIDTGEGCVNGTGQVVDYTGNYVKFTTGIGTDCIRINKFVCANEYTGYTMSYIEFATGSITGIKQGDHYQIWEDSIECLFG